MSIPAHRIVDRRRPRQSGRALPGAVYGLAITALAVGCVNRGATDAMRTANKAYRTTPLRALWQHAPYFHDGSAATLTDVVAHYNRVCNLGFSDLRQRDLIEYLKSL